MHQSFYIQQFIYLLFISLYSNQLIKQSFHSLTFLLQTDKQHLLGCLFFEFLVQIKFFNSSYILVVFLSFSLIFNQFNNNKHAIQKKLNFNRQIYFFQNKRRRLLEFFQKEIYIQKTKSKTIKNCKIYGNKIYEKQFKKLQPQKMNRYTEKVSYNLSTSIYIYIISIQRSLHSKNKKQKYDLNILKKRCRQIDRISEDYSKHRQLLVFNFIFNIFKSKRQILYEIFYYLKGELQKLDQNIKQQQKDTQRDIQIDRISENQSKYIFYLFIYYFIFNQFKAQRQKLILKKMFIYFL
ncbi:transmembrane protein, putative (macronuclear) [Tetrahymena thermophila SB210]|uniref:Transmembrane protein, putative n=1 Tax=Tetrahymena thermophila (strain SB210) TaxID=312017 RepID=W7XJC5_TETTS|nr:transmembrane protein, putative [Tetrahymena thermophila SB210]EWS75406.1 transmembrane protein, putative [Tetrahymena thermophila SB210]|eukprot:XP_012652080.1 transmembrane protein, putative [Tetrahymena thermophila SB210]